MHADCCLLHKKRELIRDGQRVKVDSGIAELLLHVWGQGIETEAACEADQTSVRIGFHSRAHAYLIFPDTHSLLSFLRVAEGERAVRQVIKYMEQKHPNRRNQLHLSNGWRVHWSGSGSSRMLDFPPEEIPAIVDRFLRSNLSLDRGCGEELPADIATHGEAVRGHGIC